MKKKKPSKSKATPKVQPLVNILMGSDSDLPVMQKTLEMLSLFDVSCEVTVASAHRTPENVHRHVKTAEKKGAKVFIAAAGGAAHLAGVVAAYTTRPVIGVPIPTGLAGGLDSLLSTVQMPSGVPVATVACGGGGAANAALLAIQILALSDERLADELVQYKDHLKENVKSKNRRVKKAAAHVL